MTDSIVVAEYLLRLWAGVAALLAASLALAAVQHFWRLRR